MPALTSRWMFIYEPDPFYKSSPFIGNRTVIIVETDEDFIGAADSIEFNLGLGIWKNETPVFSSVRTYMENGSGNWILMDSKNARCSVEQAFKEKYGRDNL